MAFERILSDTAITALATLTLLYRRTQEAIVPDELVEPKTRTYALGIPDQQLLNAFHSINLEIIDDIGAHIYSIDQVFGTPDNLLHMLFANGVGECTLSSTSATIDSPVWIDPGGRHITIASNPKYRKMVRDVLASGQVLAADILHQRIFKGREQTVNVDELLGIVAKYGHLALDFSCDTAELEDISVRTYTEQLSLVQPIDQLNILLHYYRHLCAIRSCVAIATHNVTHELYNNIFSNILSRLSLIIFSLIEHLNLGDFRDVASEYIAYMDMLYQPQITEG